MILDQFVSFLFGCVFCVCWHVSWSWLCYRMDFGSKLILAVVTSIYLYLFFFLSCVVSVKLLHDSYGNVSMKWNMQLMHAKVVPGIRISIISVPNISFNLLYIIYSFLVENFSYSFVFSCFIFPTFNRTCSLCEFVFWQLLVVVYIQLIITDCVQLIITDCFQVVQHCG